MPLVFRKDIGDSGIISVWEINETPADLANKLILSESDSQKYESYKLDKRKAEFLAIRCLLKEILDIEPLISYLPSGRPVLENSDYNLSISHTNGYAAIALSKGNNVGIDIEYPSKRVNNIYSRFISNQESEFIPEENKTAYYTLIWSLKETMYKIYDEQSIIFNEHLICEPFKISTEGEINALYCKEVSTILKYKYLVTPDYYLVYHC